jgi:hypothetical protein
MQRVDDMGIAGARSCGVDIQDAGEAFGARHVPRSLEAVERCRVAVGEACVEWHKCRGFVEGKSALARGGVAVWGVVDPDEAFGWALGGCNGEKSEEEPHELGGVSTGLGSDLGTGDERLGDASSRLKDTDFCGVETSTRLLFFFWRTEAFELNRIESLSL